MAGAEIKSDWMKRRIMSRIRGYNLNICEIVELQNLFSNLLFLRFFSNFQKLTYRPLLTFDGLILIIPNILIISLTKRLFIYIIRSQRNYMYI